MTPGVRKFALIAHITSSVGWLGAVLAFLALAIAGLSSDDATIVRSAYVAMAVVGWWVIVPFSLAAFVTGLMQSAGTEWGLFRHYWVVVKLLLTIGATTLLPMHLRVASRLSAFAVERALGFDDLRGLLMQIAGDAAMAVVVLLAATTLSVYKPWGKIGRHCGRPAFIVGTVRANSIGCRSAATRCPPSPVTARAPSARGQPPTFVRLIYYPAPVQTFRAVVVRED